MIIYIAINNRTLQLVIEEFHKWIGIQINPHFDQSDQRNNKIFTVGIHMKRHQRKREKKSHREIYPGQRRRERIGDRPERSTPWRVKVWMASWRASSGSMPRSSMFSVTRASKAFWEMVRLPIVADYPLANGFCYFCYRRTFRPVVRTTLNRTMSSTFEF